MMVMAYIAQVYLPCMHELAFGCSREEGSEDLALSFQ